MPFILHFRTAGLSKSMQFSFNCSLQWGGRREITFVLLEAIGTFEPNTLRLVNIMNRKIYPFGNVT